MIFFSWRGSPGLFHTVHYLRCLQCCYSSRLCNCYGTDMSREA